MHDDHAFRTQISAGLDGELEPSEARALDEHLEVCEDCRAFRERLSAVRTAVRVRAQEPVPTFAHEAIVSMASEGRRLLRRDEWFKRTRLAFVSAMACGLLLIGTSFPWGGEGSGTATAAEVTAGIRAAADDLAGYHAEMTIVERGWHEAVPRRSFGLEVWFEAPESLRIEVSDLTEYPEGAWPRNDVTLVAGPHSWSLEEPSACPAEVLPSCSIAPGIEMSVLTGRAPFDGTTAFPTDLILPLESVAYSGAFEIVGTSEIAGREALVIALSARQAEPLLRALRPGGSWVGISPEADVRIALDDETWFPLGVEVWEEGRLTFRMRTSSLEINDVSVDVRVDPSDGRTRHAGWKEGSSAELKHLEPTELQGLEPYRSGTQGSSQVSAYAKGMAWLRVSYGKARRPPVDPGAPVSLGGDVVGYYLPAGDRPRRSVDIYSSRAHIRLETNLSREQLLEVAGSIAVPGRVRLAETISQAELADLPLVMVPEWLPLGYSYSSGSILDSSAGETVVAHYRAPEYELFGDGVVITASTATGGLPPTSMSGTIVDLEGAPARWLAEVGQLEWMDGETYRAVTVASAELALAYEIARSLR